ncbi:hypothetical protein MTX78_12650 [Hymenobacter tibetensis]|uniref:Uncharacterized protein n=1 Tax=Hymenobacter tibetensis TaxID=497967 RepID=A0ABY4CSB3_9BACT|nr:hypothetical protein [Hymenobacter tibetensis]UOG72977.1 hypothetical protein MTX78_12650 [Hymenobacter tibetensis]
MPEAMRDKATTDIAPSGGAFEGQQSTVVGASQAPGAPAPNWPLFPTAPAAGPSLTPTGNTAGATPPHVPTPPLAYPYTAASASSSALEATSLGGKAPTGSTIQTETVVPSQAQAFVEKNKAIRRIVIFYQDGTFTDYQPDAK